ncbi:MAG: hypothetical protein ABJA49_11905 [Betaproteobacteria bacterium]
MSTSRGTGVKASVIVCFHSEKVEDGRNANTALRLSKALRSRLHEGTYTQVNQHLRCDHQAVLGANSVMQILANQLNRKHEKPAGALALDAMCRSRTLMMVSSGISGRPIRLQPSPFVKKRLYSQPYSARPDLDPAKREIRKKLCALCCSKPSPPIRSEIACVAA